MEGNVLVNTSHNIRLCLHGSEIAVFMACGQTPPPPSFQGLSDIGFPYQSRLEGFPSSRNDLIQHPSCEIGTLRKTARDAATASTAKPANSNIFHPLLSPLRNFQPFGSFRVRGGGRSSRSQMLRTSPLPIGALDRATARPAGTFAPASSKTGGSWPQNRASS